MKKEVKFESNDGGIITAESPEQLRRNYLFVGFHSPCERYRYMIIPDSPSGIRAVRPNGEWTEFSDGTFYVFDTQKELLCWVAEGREG